MGVISDNFGSVYRDYETAGVPGSGEHEPVKSEIRGLGAIIENALGTVGLADVDVSKTTRALLYADLAWPADSVGLVYADATDAYNDLYVKSGAPGGGAWTNTGVIHGIISGLAASQVAAQVVTQVDPKVAAATAQAVIATDQAVIATTQAAIATAMVASLVPLPALLADYIGTVSTYGATPDAGTSADPLGGNTMYQGTFAATTADGYLDSFSVWVKVVGSGALRLDVRIPYSTPSGGATAALYQRINIAGIASTGLKVFRAGVDFPRGITILKGSRFDIGCPTGGAQASYVVSIGNGDTRTYGGGGYNVLPSHGFNYVPLLQVTTTTKNAQVSDDVNRAKEMANLIARDGSVIEYTMGDSGLLEAAGWGGAMGQGAYPNGTYPVLRDGIFKGVEYGCYAGDAGDCYFIVIRNGVEVAHWRATLVVGTKQYVAAPTGRDAILLKKGDLVWTQPITGTVGARGYTAQGSYFAASNYLFSGLTYTNDGSDYNRVGAFRVVVERPRLARETAQVADRHATQTLRETFPGVALPAKWSNSAAAFTVNAGLVSPSAPAASWANYCIFADNTNAHRREARALIEMGDATNIGGIMWLSQQAATLPMGTIAVIDGPAAKLRVYRGGNPGPLDAGLSADLPWAPNAADLILLTSKIDREVLTVTARNMGSGQSVTINSKASAIDIHGGFMRGRIAAVMYSGAGAMKWRYITSTTDVSLRDGGVLVQQDSTADILYLGGYNRVWWHLVEDIYGRGNVMNCAKAAADSGSCLASLGQDFIALLPQAAAISGSIAAATNVLTVTATTGIIRVGQMLHGPNITPGTTVTALGTGTGGVGTYTVSVAQTVPATAIAAVEPTAAQGVKMFWGCGVNPRHGGGENDAQWYANYLADSLAAAAIVEGVGGQFIVVTTNPANYIATYAKLLNDNIMAGAFGTRDVVDMNRRLVASAATRGTWANLTRSAGGDGLHEDPIYESPNMAVDFIEQRPEMAGLAA